MKFLHLFETLLLCTFGSCSILVSSNLPEVNQDLSSGVIEAEAPPLHAYREIQGLTEGVTELLQRQRQYYLSKLDILGTACKNDQEGITYDVSSDEFQDPRMKLLVKVMSKKLAEIAEITMDDLNSKLKNISLLVSQRMADKISPMLNKIALLKSRVQTLATKETISQIVPVMTYFFKTKSGEISTIISTLETKPQLTTKSSAFSQFTETLIEKIDALKHCENKLLFNNAAERSYTLKNDFAALREKLVETVRQTDNAAANALDDLLEQMIAKAKENGEEISTLLATTAGIGPVTAGRLDSLNEVLEQISNVDHSEMATATEAPETLIQIPQQDTMEHPPCMDSNLRACSTAILLKMCHLRSVAFHCCRSCTDAGRLSYPPNYSVPRFFPVVQALAVSRS